jgi:hypothetical protein
MWCSVLLGIETVRKGTYTYYALRRFTCRTALRRAVPVKNTNGRGPGLSDSTRASDLRRERNQIKHEEQGVNLDELSHLAYAPPLSTPMQSIRKSDENELL